jgi:hypothetical protein
VVDYQLIQAAFSNIQYIEDALKTAQQAGDPDGGLKRLLTDASHTGRINTIQEAEAIALRAGLNVVDRLKARRHMKRLAELPGASEFLAGLHPKKAALVVNDSALAGPLSVSRAGLFSRDARCPAPAVAVSPRPRSPPPAPGRSSRAPAVRRRTSA